MPLNQAPDEALLDVFTVAKQLSNGAGDSSGLATKLKGSLQRSQSLGMKLVFPNGPPKRATGDHKNARKKSDPKPKTKPKIQPEKGQNGQPLPDRHGKFKGPPPNKQTNKNELGAKPTPKPKQKIEPKQAQQQQNTMHSDEDLLIEPSGSKVRMWRCGEGKQKQRPTVLSHCEESKACGAQRVSI